MEVQDRLKIAGKIIPPLEVARRMGMDHNVLECMLMRSMDRADELRDMSAKSGKPALPPGQVLAAAFDQVQYAHGGFHEFFHQTRKSMEDLASQVVLARGRAINAEHEWRNQNPEMRKCLGDLNDARRAAGLAANDPKHLEALDFSTDTGEKSSTRKVSKLA